MYERQSILVTLKGELALASSAQSQTERLLTPNYYRSYVLAEKASCVVSANDVG